MRTLIAASAMTLGSFAFQLGLQAGWFNHLIWLAPWAWGVSVALWVVWIISHPKIEKDWLKSFHEKIGRGIHPIRLVIFVFVFLLVGLVIRRVMHGVALTSSPSGTVQAQEPPPSPPPKISVKRHGSQTQKNSGGTNVQQQQNNSGGNNIQQNGEGNVGIIGNQNEVNIGPKMAGWLKPASDPDPALPAMCGSKRGFTLYAADSVFTGLAFPMTLLSIRDKPLVTIDRNKDGEMALTTDIFNSETPARIIASIEKNEFHVNGNQVAWVKTPDRSTLIVIDQFKNEVLRVHYMNDHAMEFSGTLYSRDIPFPIVVGSKGLRIGPVGYGASCYTGNETPEVVIGVLDTRQAALLNVN